MARRRIFTVVTPLGYRVFLSRDRWRQIIRYKHPALVGREQDVRACLVSPTIVRRSAKEAEVHMYYAPCEDVHLCVVVAAADGDEHFVITAYFTRNIKRGLELWKS